MRYRSVSVPTLLVLAASGLLLFEAAAASSTDFRAQDPGVRTGAAGAGNPLPNLTAHETDYFYAGQADFAEEESVAEGLGPRLNLNSCGSCHSQPALGGTSPATNPQVAFAGSDSGTDLVPPFLSLNGPVREARFVRNADGTRDGGVHALFTITGRTGADGCTLAQPDWAT